MKYGEAYEETETRGKVWNPSTLAYEPANTDALLTATNALLATTNETLALVLAKLEEIRVILAGP